MDKTTASLLSYELGGNGEKKSMETGILLLKVDVGHFTLVNLDILGNSLRDFNLMAPVSLKLIEDEIQCQRSVLFINILQMICMQHVFEAVGPYQ